jgi:transposase
VKEGRKPEPTASVIDTQSVKTSTNVPVTSQGTDAAKKIVGRKRGILTDTLGLLLAVTVTAASLSENTLGIRLLDQAKKTYPTISKSWVDTGFNNAVVEHGANLGIDVEVVNRNPGVRGFHVVKRRWVVERSIGWAMMHRRLARDYETLPASSEAMINIASIDNLGAVLAVGGRLVVVPEAAPLEGDSALFGQLWGVLALTDDTVFVALIRLADALA